jgi:GTP-binding protein Era
VRSGFVPVVGRPNVGKSTLVNQMVGSKVAITSSRPQTTRNVIRGVVSGLDHQMVLLDTPGVHKPRNELGTRLNAMVTRTLSDADAVLFVIDASAPVGPGDRLIAERLAKEPTKVVVAVNKVDLAKRTQTVSQLLEAAEWPFTDVFPVSAVTGDGVTELTRDLVNRLEEGPAYYPEGVLSDQPEEMVVSEIIREKFLDRLREELPHSVMVRLEEISQRDNGLIDVRAKVVVERDSQRGIVLGKGGELLKAAGTEARLELETILGDRVNLALRVAVEKDWQSRPQLLDRFGFERG